MRNCTNCKYSGQTGDRCYDCKRGRGNLAIDLWESACPLPRIGSKSWNWKRHGLEWVCDAFGFEIREDPHPGRPQWFCSDLHANFAAVGSVRLAKRVVETEARYRWRRENGKKI